MRPRPITFDGCAGFLHPGRTDHGVLVLSTLGPEGNTVHRGLRELAQMLSRDGSSVLRYDLPGTGQSIGDLGTGDLLERWIESVARAAECLRRSCGVTAISLVGIRIGASIALLAQAENGGFDRIVAIAPVVRGRSYMRELRMLSAAQNLSGVVDAETGVSSINLAGEVMSAEVAAEIGRIDLRQLKRCWSRVLLVDADRPDAASLAERLRSLGAEPVRRGFPDGPGFLCDALESAIPIETFETSRAWLTPAPRLDPLNGGVAGATSLEGDRYVEHHLSFGRDDGLHGILAMPRLTNVRPGAALFVNTGLTRSSGDGRITVEVARALAGTGIASFRIDVAGIGDSPERLGRKREVLYDVAAIEDVREAIELLRSRGLRDVVLVGTCSGAYLALQSAAVDARIGAVIAINVQKFVWSEGMSIKIDRARSPRMMRSYLRELRTAAGWRRAARGWRKATPIVVATLKRACGRAIRQYAAWLNRRRGPMDSCDQARALLSTLSSRRQRVTLVYSEDDPGWAELTTLFGRRGRDLRHLGSVFIRTIAGADHILTGSDARAALREMIAAETALLAVAGRASTHAASDDGCLKGAVRQREPVDVG